MNTNKPFILFFYIFIYIPAISQSGLSNKTAVPLNVGERMPDISLGKVLNNSGDLSSAYLGKRNFEDFKGKLVILDFWHTGCSPCIQGFMKMSALQERFRDKIQIFLVNPVQNEIVVSRWLKDRNKDRSENIVPDNLPMLVDAKKLHELFPIRGEIGYHVWIAPDSKVVLRGISENTHEQKIEEILAGKNISFIQDNARAYDARSAPFFTAKNETFHTALRYNSSFSKFIDTLASPYGGNGVANLVDSVSETIRNSFINQSILFLYQYATKSKDNKSQIFAGNKVVIEGSDRCLIASTDNNYIQGPYTDETFRTTRFGYEQIVPLTTSDNRREEMMLEDLNRYFDNEFGIIGNLENREVEGLKLIVTDTTKLNKSKHKSLLWSTEFKNGKSFLKYEGGALSEIFRQYFMNAAAALKNMGYKGLVIDDFNYTAKVDLTIPAIYDLKNLGELRGYLNECGLDLVEGKKNLEILVIKNK